MDTRRPNWHEDAFFGLHYDLHANEGDTVLGAELTEEHLQERLVRVRPDWIQCDCKGHAGYTSWPTAVGSTSPGVVRDALRIHRDVTARMGIPLGMHYSGVWDSRAVELHPEWAVVGPDGKRDQRMTCRLSAYDDELLVPQMLELIDKYAVDGFWVDGENWAAGPCWCHRCRAEFARRTGTEEAPTQAGEKHWEAWLAFHRDLFVEHVTRYADAVHARKPDCMVCSNWMYTIRQPEPVQAPVDYLSGDFSPAWGADRAALEGRLLDCRGLPWDLMAWAFAKSGSMGDDPPWCMKTATHLCQECAEVVALGGAVMVYAKPQRSGWLVGWHNEVLAEVADFCRARKDPCFQSKTASETAVLHLADHYYTCNDPLYNYGAVVHPVEGALHALLEQHRSTDLLTEDAALDAMSGNSTHSNVWNCSAGDPGRWRGYKLIVVPEQTRLSPQLLAKLTEFAEAGGSVLLSGAHLAADYPGLVGATPDGKGAFAGSSWGVVSLPVAGDAIGVCGDWTGVVPAEGTEVVATALSEQEVTKDDTGRAVVTQRRLGNGAVIAVHGPVFRNYFLGHYPPLRRFLDGLVDRFGIDWLVTLDAPRHLELILRRKDGKLLINLLNRGAAETLSPQRVMIEELTPVEDVTVRVRRLQEPVSVSLVPADAVIDWTYADGVVTVNVPRVEIHSVVVVE
jgi:alpha-L-fucosidase